MPSIAVFESAIRLKSAYDNIETQKVKTRSFFTLISIKKLWHMSELIHS